MDIKNPAHLQCVHRVAPNHTQTLRRLECGQILFNEMTSNSFQSISTFPYIPILSSLENILVPHGMVDLCLAWKNRKSNDQGLLCNIYDGQIWTELSETYLKSDDSILPLCLALNVDWFQPFKHTQYSVGALYLTVLNLPRALRLKEETIIY